MKRFVIFTSIMFLSLSVFARNEINQNIKTVTLKPIKVLFDDSKSNDLVHFKTTPWLEIDEKLNIYLMGNMLHKVYKLNPKGKLLFEVAKNGLGPGEIFLPSSIKAVGTEFIISDQLGLSFFNRKGKYLRRFKLINYIHSFTAFKEKVYVYNALLDKPIVVYDFNGKQLGSFGKRLVPNYSVQSKGLYKTSLDRFTNNCFIHTNGKFIFVINASLSFIQVYNFDGNLIKQKNINLEEYESQIEENKRFFFKDGVPYNNGQIRWNRMFQWASVLNDRIFLLLIKRERIDDIGEIVEIDSHSLKCVKRLIFSSVYGKNYKINCRNFKAVRVKRSTHFYLSLFEDGDFCVGLYKTN